MRSLRLTLALTALLLVSACRHPLAIQGEGDIIELNRGERGCALEEFQADFARCTDNEVSVTESVRYRALPRPGWRFARWDGYCSVESRGRDCEIDYTRAGADWWQENFPDSPAAPLRAIFVRDDAGPIGASYIASQFGVRGSAGYASLLDALFFSTGSYRYTVQQASSLGDFDRAPAAFQRSSDSLLLAGTTAQALVPSGGATQAGDFLTLIDTDASDGTISSTYFQPKRESAGNSEFSGTYFCGHVLTNGQALFFRANVNGRGTGSLIILEDRQRRQGQQAQISYEVSADGTMLLDYAGARIAGSLSSGGGVFTGSQIGSGVQGAAVCVRTSSNKRIANVAGAYYGAWMSTQPITAVTELVLDSRGQTVETVLRDSTGGRNYTLGTNFMLVLANGQIETRDANGAVSPDGRILFLIQTDPNRYPTLIVYVRET
ncbi:MAG: hypothetical protein AAF699_12075 [Pseudomonadota bacterium]